jgi:glycosyltransferase involved in cell wall biosynthesis
MNGYLVPRREPEAFAERITELLTHEFMRRAFSQAARQAALKHESSAVTGRWDVLLADCLAGGSFR